MTKGPASGMTFYLKPYGASSKFKNFWELPKGHCFSPGITAKDLVTDTLGNLQQTGVIVIIEHF